MPGARILLVEDDEVLCDVIGRNLRARGHEVRTAVNAESALAQLRGAQIDLIILDINLPDQTGWEVLRTAQREGWLRPRAIDGHVQTLPVGVLSAARLSPGRLAQVLPPAYLPKPLTLQAATRRPARGD